MPEFFSVTGRRWKLVLLICILATLVALSACLLSPRKYLGEVTALPANAEVADRARIFGQHIEGLYRELGEPDELDKIEGTAKLDTIFLAVAKQFYLPSFNAANAPDVLTLHNRAKELQKNTRINRTGYGELKIRVWDKDPQMAANLANALLQQLNTIHRHLRTENNRLVLQRLKEEYMLTAGNTDSVADSTVSSISSRFRPGNASPEQLGMYRRLISEYELALKTNPNALLVVEPARPLPWHDKPQTAQVVAFTFLASLLFSSLLVYVAESRRKAV
jgi:uncharacterized protein involved in exopolysaccharide biosynthesis